MLIGLRDRQEDFEPAQIEMESTCQTGGREISGATVAKIAF
jgi:hypothetical protein